MSELGGERIDIIEWSDNVTQFIEDALSPATVLSVALDEAEKRATVEVSEDQQSLAIGRGGQNVRLAAKLTGWSIDIRPVGGKPEEEAMETDENEGETVGVSQDAEQAEEALIEEEEGATEPAAEAVESGEEQAAAADGAEAVAGAPEEAADADKDDK